MPHGDREPEFCRLLEGLHILNREDVGPALQIGSDGIQVSEVGVDILANASDEERLEASSEVVEIAGNSHFETTLMSAWLVTGFWEA